MPISDETVEHEPLDEQMTFRSHMQHLLYYLRCGAGGVLFAIGVIALMPVGAVAMITGDPSAALDRQEWYVGTVWLAFWLSYPAFVYHLARFIVPGLRPHERRGFWLLAPIPFLSIIAIAYGSGSLLWPLLNTPKALVVLQYPWLGLDPLSVLIKFQGLLFLWAVALGVMPLIAKSSDTSDAVSRQAYLRVLFIATAVIAVVPAYLIAIALLILLDACFWRIRQRPWQVFSFLAALGIGEGLKFGVPILMLASLVLMIAAFMQLEPWLRVSQHYSPDALRNSLANGLTVWQPLPPDPEKRIERRWSLALMTGWMLTFAVLAVLPWDLLGRVLLGSAEVMGGIPEFATTIFVAFVLSVPWWYLRLRAFARTVTPLYPWLREGFTLSVLIVPAAVWYVTRAYTEPFSWSVGDLPWYFPVLGIDAAQINLKWAIAAFVISFAAWGFLLDKLSHIPNTNLKQYAGMVSGITVVFFLIPSYLIALVLLGAVCLDLFRSLLPWARRVVYLVPTAIIIGEITRHGFPMLGLFALVIVGSSLDTVRQAERTRRTERGAEPEVILDPIPEPVPPPTPAQPDPIAAREILAHIGQSLAAADAPVRVAAANAAAHARDPLHAPHLAQIAETDSDQAARVAAIEALARCAPVVARQVFAELLQVPDQELAIRWAIVLAMGDPPAESARSAPPNPPLVEELY